ncbi:FAD:protein FMN transferase [Parendozoicomonas sp. Alg238-R29]|uniref:FAD:protein FMN transferase n=1 Tax=Parendozoicomonas sp. Alg238-R29 TaxID=2993446 RepID=UPI00248DD1F6|nr:FAD:protein FMN transferase [Parendozoicomonas sp. Alg238-R29]
MSRRLFIAIAVIFLLALVVRFSDLFNTPRIAEAGGPTMGTSWSVKYVTNSTPDAEVLQGIKQSLVDVNQIFSTYIPDSELMMLNKTPVGVPFTASPELFHLLEQAIHISTISGGAYDVTVGALVNLWGFGSGSGFQREMPEQIGDNAQPAFAKWLEKGRVTSVPTPDAIARALAETGYQSLILDRKNRTITKSKPVFVDLSSIAKGYGVDQVARVLEQSGLTSYMVEVGGEVRLRGKKSGGEGWKIAIREPVLESRVNTVVSLDNKGIATSGDYLNYYEVEGVHFSHLIDARTGYPEKHRLASVAVVNYDTGLADAYATMFMILGEKAGIELAREKNIDAYFIYHTDKGFTSRATGNFNRYVLDK